MSARFEDLWAGADDGASCPIRVSPGAEGRELEIDGLLDAWLHERTESIECSLLLGRAVGLLAKILAEGAVTPRRRKQAIRLIRFIEGRGPAGHGGL